VWLLVPVSKHKHKHTHTHTHTQEKSEKSKKDDNTDFPEDLYATKPGVHARDDNVDRVRARASRIERQAHHHELGPQRPLPHKKLKRPAASTSFYLQPHFRCLSGHLQITCEAIL
jgi:hypothetical protein